jgi:serine/threonine protein kinase
VAEEFGPYLVYEQIGLGGMATVHRAETQGVAGFRKTVALKRMLPNVAADATLVQSFIREARLASHLRHANVAQTYDLGKVGDIYFIAMELVDMRADAVADRTRDPEPDLRRARLRAQPV